MDLQKIYRLFDIRSLLLTLGFVLFCIAGNPLGIFDAFLWMYTSSLVPVVVMAVGFVQLVTHTKCNEHLAALMLKYMLRIRKWLVPLTVIGVWFVGWSINSPSALTIALAPILVPNLIACGVKPAMAATAFVCGTWGVFSSYTTANIVYINQISGVPIRTLAHDSLPMSFALVIICAAVVYITTKVLKEDTGQIADNIVGDINIVKAILPMLPVIILMIFPTIKVEIVMLLCAVITCVVTRLSPKDGLNEFLKGVSVGYLDIMSIVACAIAFAKGLEAIGVVAFVLNTFSGDVGIMSAIIPFTLAIVTGSGDAPTMVFNQSVVANMVGHPSQGLYGMMSHLAGNLGRTTSPVAALVIIAAGVAGVNPLDIVKRAILPMTVCIFVAMLIAL